MQWGESKVGELRSGAVGEKNRVGELEKMPLRIHFLF
jgi:hypothetical protein